MKNTLRKIFGIYPGEGLATLRFVQFAIFWAFSTSSFETLVDGLFLRYAGASSLPLAYFISAAALIFSSSIILYLLRSRSPYWILCRALVVFLAFSAGILCLLACYEMSELPLGFWYGMKIYSRIFFSVFLALAWTFIDQYHDLQDAKRVYSLYSAAYFIGLVLSGGCISLFLSYLGTKSFFLISAASTLLALREAKNITQKTPAVHDDTIEGIFSGDRESLSSMIRKLLQSPYTISLLALSLLHEFTLTTTEFNYMETFDRAFQERALQSNFTANNVSEFLGKCRAWISFGNVFVGGLLYRPFVKRMGLTNIVVLPPMFFFLVYMFWVFRDTVPVAILGLIATDGIAFTLEDNSFNLLTKAVPVKLKSKVRIVNDSFFEPIGMMISAIMLFFLPSYQSRAFGLLLSFGLILVTLFLRALYSKALFANLKEQVLRFEKTLATWTASWSRREKRYAKEAICKKLASEQEEEKLLAMSTLLAFEDRSTIPLIVEEMERFSPKGKVSLLALLDRSFCHAEQPILERVSTWSDSYSPWEFQQKSHFYLAKRGRFSIENALGHLGGKSPLWIRASAILTLQKGSKDASSFDLSCRELDRMLGHSDMQEVLIGLQLLKELPSIDSAQKACALLRHPSLEVRREAASALSTISNPSLYLFAKSILTLLQEETDSELRIHCLRALGKFSDASTVEKILLKTVHFRPVERRLTEKIIAEMGPKNIPTLLGVLKDVRIPDRPRILASKILMRLSPIHLQAHLEEILHVEKERAYFYFYYGNTAEKAYPDIPLKDLTQTLLTSFQSVIDFMIHLLGAVGQVEDPELLVISLHSSNAKVHSSAVEALEMSCDAHVFSWILPLIEEVPWEEKHAAYKKYATKDIDLELPDILHKLEQSPSAFDRIVAARLQASIKPVHWKQERFGRATPYTPTYKDELKEHETTQSY